MIRTSSLVSWASVFFLCWGAACATGTDNGQDLDPADTSGAGGNAGSEGGSAGKNAAGDGGSSSSTGGKGGAGDSGAAGDGGTAGDGGAAGEGGDAGAAGTGGDAGAGGETGGSGLSGSSGQSGSSGSGGSSGTSGQGGTGGSAAGQGGSGGTGGTGGAGQGGAGGSSGTSGQGGDTGQGGAQGGSAGQGGSDSGGSGGAGTGGSGGSGGLGGSGGSGGSGSPNGTLVVLASTSGQPYAGAYKPASGGWSTQVFDAAILGQPALIAFGGQAHAVMRVSNGSKEILRKSIWSSGTWSNSVQLGAGYETQDNPSFSANAQIGWVTYRYLTKHYSISFKGALFGSQVQLGNDSPQAFGQSPATVAVNGTEAWGVYAGNNEGVYTVKHNGSTWGPSVSIFGAGAKNYISPEMIFDEQAQPTVLFVRNSDSVLCITTRTGSNWSAPAPVANDALTNSPPTLARVGGGLLVVWRGNNNDSLYYAFRPTSGSWQAPTVLDSSGGTPSKPAVTPGTDGADAEVVYTKNGELRHARFQGGAMTAPVAVSGASNVTAVGAVLVE